MPKRSSDAGLLSIALRASQTLDLGGFLDLCAEGIARALAPAAVHAYLRRAEAGDLELQGSWPGEQRGARRPPPLLDGALLGSPAGVEGAGRPKPAGRGSPWPGIEADRALLLPLGEKVGEASEGLFLVLAEAGRPFFPEEAVESARGFLHLIAPALNNVRLMGELKETAVRDDLAGCYNRRHFESFLGEEIARAKRFRSRVSIVFFDMDNLKSVNTEFGHSMGSRSLQEVSDRITGGIRKIDKLFRFGGDEFCVVLPETDARGAYEVAERTRRRIAAEPLLVPEIGGVRLSASLGLATFPEHGGSAESLVRAADRAMQEVKRSGKNAIGVAGREEDGPLSANGRAGGPWEERR